MILSNRFIFKIITIIFIMIILSHGIAESKILINNSIIEDLNYVSIKSDIVNDIKILSKKLINEDINYIKYIENNSKKETIKKLLIDKMNNKSIIENNNKKEDKKNNSDDEYFSLINSKYLSKKVIDKKLYYIKKIENDKRSYINNRNIDYDKLYNIIKLHFKYRYIWGKMDCSKLVFNVFKMYGEPIPRTTSQKYYILFKGESFNWNKSSCGDIIWFTFNKIERPKGHIGIILKPIYNTKNNNNTINFVYFTQNGSSTGPIISIVRNNNKSYWNRYFDGCKIGLR